MTLLGKKTTATLFVLALQACGDGSQASLGDDGSGGAAPEDADDERPDDTSDDSAGPATPDDTSADDDAIPDDDATPGADADAAPGPGEDILPLLDDDSDGCQREVLFEAVALSDPPPFDVVIVADHSGSIAWSREELTAGLRDLLDDAKGHDVRVFVLTPTQYGASSPDPIDPVSGEDFVMWRDPVTGTPFGNPMTRYSQACWDAAGVAMPCPTYPSPPMAFSLEGWWNFQMPEPVAVIRKGMTGPERGEQQRALTDAVLALGTDGSPQEQPVCTLNRYVLQDEQELPDHVIFLVLSDEDDTSEPEDCLLGHRQETSAIGSTTYTSGCTSDCDAYQFAMTQPAAQRTLEFSCVPVDDMGNQFPGQAVPGQTFLPPVEVCDAAVSDCNTGDLAGAKYGCAEGSVVVDCQKLCAATSDYYSTCLLSLPTEVDLCTESFVHGDMEYADFADYCSRTIGGDEWSACQREGLFASGGVSYSGTSVPEPLMFSADTISMVREFQNTATEKFGESGFVVETILFDPAFSCELAEGQSHGTTLRELASTPEDVFPICESYAPALSRAERFARALLQTEYALELGPHESIEALVVTDEAGVERTLNATDYSHANGQLLINPEAISSGDVSLNVQILNVCVNSAR
jgi:hypothetical protein